ncbi:phosphomannomutase/phosphoglucomutase, partial [Candidatus Woesearchaeota archaeon]|nr:phosphomannomutase/phosphoglucomutase [Candidatus Woesearchaeota archaeon]
MSIFKAYDIRGVYPSELDEKLAYKIGRAFVTFLNADKVVVSQDMRKSSASLKKELIRGITDQGADVIEVEGLCSTPKSYFACWFLDAPCSVMVTASHNPGQYNGFKFTREQAIPISGDTGIKEIEQLVLENRFKEPQKKGSVATKDITQAYKKHILSMFDIRRIRPLKVVIDAGNGMGGKDMDLVLDKLPIKTVRMYFEPDGDFPNHEANPLKEENIKDIKKRVIEEKADFGIAIDGDADRVFFIDENSEVIPADFITCLIAEDILKEKKKAKVLYDLRSSWVVKEVIEKNKGKAGMCKVGHSFIKEQMRKEDAAFAGELSGHFYFRDNFFTDSGVIAALKVLQIISEKGKKLSELVRPLKKYFASGEINSEVEDKEAKMEELAEKYSSGKVSRLDGVRIDFKDWWFNVRPSNTEPLLRLNLEAKSKKLMEEKRDEVLGVIR